MGKGLLAFFDKAELLGGKEAKMKLAEISTITPSIAASLEDTPDSILIFKEVFEVFEKELRGKNNGSSPNLGK